MEVSSRKYIRLSYNSLHSPRIHILYLDACTGLLFVWENSLMNKIQTLLFIVSVVINWFNWRVVRNLENKLSFFDIMTN